MTQQCSFCVEHKVKVYRTHKREDCPLLRAAYCAHCACHGLHFSVDCPRKPVWGRPTAKPLDPAPPLPASNNLIMRDEDAVIKSNLKLWGYDPKGKIPDKKLKKLVDAYAREEGYDGVSYV